MKGNNISLKIHTPVRPGWPGPHNIFEIVLSNFESVRPLWSNLSALDSDSFEED